jgi:hypothetical protein
MKMIEGDRPGQIGGGASDNFEHVKRVPNIGGRSDRGADRQSSPGIDVGGSAKGPVLDGLQRKPGNPRVGTKFGEPRPGGQVGGGAKEIPVMSAGGDEGGGKDQPQQPHGETPPKGGSEGKRPDQPQRPSGDRPSREPDEVRKASPKKPEGDKVSPGKDTPQTTSGETREPTKKVSAEEILAYFGTDPDELEERSIEFKEALAKPEVQEAFRKMREEGVVLSDEHREPDTTEDTDADIIPFRPRRAGVPVDDGIKNQAREGQADNNPEEVDMRPALRELDVPDAVLDQIDPHTGTLKGYGDAFADAARPLQNPKATLSEITEAVEGVDLYSEYAEKQVRRILAESGEPEGKAFEERVGKIVDAITGETVPAAERLDEAGYALADLRDEGVENPMDAARAIMEGYNTIKAVYGGRELGTAVETEAPVPGDEASPQPTVDASKGPPTDTSALSKKEEAVTAHDETAEDRIQRGIDTVRAAAARAAGYDVAEPANITKEEREAGARETAKLRDRAQRASKLARSMIEARGEDYDSLTPAETFRAFNIAISQLPESETSLQDREVAPARSDTGATVFVERAGPPADEIIAEVSADLPPAFDPASAIEAHRYGEKRVQLTPGEAAAAEQAALIEAVRARTRAIAEHGASSSEAQNARDEVSRHLTNIYTLGSGEPLTE